MSDSFRLSVITLLYDTMNKLTENFTLEEMERSSVAAASGIDNHAPHFAVSNLQRLCQSVLQPLRDWYGAPVIVTSGYRSRMVNILVGGSSRSYHLSGRAADIVPAETSGRSAILRSWYLYIKEHLAYRELLLERGKDGGEWIHVAL